MSTTFEGDNMVFVPRLHKFISYVASTSAPATPRPVKNNRPSATTYRKSLELDPKNQNAANKLKELEQK